MYALILAALFVPAIIAQPPPPMPNRVCYPVKMEGMVLNVTSGFSKKFVVDNFKKISYFGDVAGNNFRLFNGTNSYEFVDGSCQGSVQLPAAFQRCLPDTAKLVFRAYLGGGKNKLPIRSYNYLDSRGANVTVSVATLDNVPIANNGPFNALYFNIRLQEINTTYLNQDVSGCP